MVSLELHPTEAQALMMIIQEKLGAIHQLKELEKPLISLAKKLMPKPPTQTDPMQ